METAKEVINRAEEIKAELLNPQTLEALIINGDLSRLTQTQTVEYYKYFCHRLGLDPGTQPFKLLSLQGKKVLYLDRGGASQLNKVHSVSHEITKREKVDDLYIVTAKARTPDGRYTESIGAVNTKGLSGEALANALMKGETKAKRRATIDLLGLGMLDETEASTIPGAVASSSSPIIDERGGMTRELMARELIELLSTSKTDAQFKVACRGFQKKYGVNIWGELTYSTTGKSGETFKDIADSMRPGNVMIETPWRTRLSECTTLKIFHELVKEFDGDAALNQDQEAFDALQKKAVELGLQKRD